MKCPVCESVICYGWLDDEYIERGDELSFPSCGTELRYIEEETDSLYHGNNRRIGML